MPTNPGDTQFPTALPSADTLFRVVNFDTTTDLNTGISAGTLSIILDDASLYPASGAIKIEDEIIFYTSKASNTLTIPASGGRGADGSVAASHSAGATVRAVAIARHHMVLAEEITALATKMGTGADTPASGEFFKGTGAGASGWSALTSGEVTTALGYTPAPVVTLTAGTGLSGGGDTSTNRTFAFDPTELAGLTWGDGSQASYTWTFNLSGTDPVWTIGSSSMDLSTGTLKQGGTAVSLTGHAHSAADITSGTLVVGRGGTGATTFTTNGVLYGNTTSAVQVTAQGAANSVLTANAGAPSFSATPTLDRVTVNPSAFVYDLNVNTLSVGFNVGNGTPASPISANVPVNQTLSGFMFNATHSGEGRLLGFDFNLTATGAVQASEPVRGIIGRVTNSGTGNAKTSCLRFGATGSGSNASQLIAGDADITPVAGTNNASTVFAATVEGTTDDKGSGLYLQQGASNPRWVMGVGMIAPIKFLGAAYRAWMGTGSAAAARAFQVLNNAGGEIGYIHQDGTFQSGLAGTISGAYSLSGITSGTIAILPQSAAGSYNFNLPTGAGTSGQPLLSGGGGASPMTFGSLSQANVSNLGLVMISTSTATGATIDFTGLDATYDSYILVVSNAKPATDDVEAWLRIGTGGTPTYQTSGYSWSTKPVISNSELVPIGSTSDAQIKMSYGGSTIGVGNASGEAWSGTIAFDNPASTTVYPMFRINCSWNRAADGLAYGGYGMGQYNTVGAITAIRFMFSSGNVNGGRFTLYGYRKS